MAIRPSRHGDRRDPSRGQSLVEFVLIAPIMLILLLAIADLARVYTTMLTVESAAREAADYGAFISSNWSEANKEMTVQGMRDRACIASSNLTDYEPDVDLGCTNPSMTVSLVDADGDPASACDDPDRVSGPCRVRVDLKYNFKLIAPLGFDALGTRFGLPSSVPFTRTSIFAISDFELDAP